MYEPHQPHFFISAVRSLQSVVQPAFGVIVFKQFYSYRCVCEPKWTNIDTGACRLLKSQQENNHNSRECI